MFWWNLFGFDCKSDTGTRSGLENRHLWSERKKQIFIRTYQYQHIKYHSIHNMLNRWIWNIQYNCLYLNNFIREIRTTAIISIATHAATSWLEIVKNTLGNFYAGGVMINPRYQSVVHAGDRSKDVLSVPWTRWVSPNHQISKNILVMACGAFCMSSLRETVFERYLFCRRWWWKTILRISLQQTFWRFLHMVRTCYSVSGNHPSMKPWW